MTLWMIRSELPSDFHAIAELHALAFAYSFGMGETTLVSTLRTRKNFEPELSLVCVLNDQVIGHILFTPQDFLIEGNKVNGLMLSPLAVHPDYQKLGVGSALITEGLRNARDKGYELSTVLGHPHFYTRFGFKGKAWMDEKVKIPLETIFITEPVPSIRERRVELADLPKLRDMWESTYGHSPFSIIPGNSLLDWISPANTIQASAILIDEELAGYVRYNVADPGLITMVIAIDSAAFIHITHYLKGKLNPLQYTHLLLPISSLSPLLHQLDWAYDISNETYAEYMVIVLDGPTRPILLSYFNDIQNGTKTRGFLIWPTEFDLC
ncbi:GNAT family N-acetyltransferase [Paenibacillus sp. Marseille-Q4541]|uniref:GNAT family N-acetyltransferase n=1 Tax=Paenibacillus sp. Marseille-Q4541 TaxID=2831522 RepID=UPI001BA80412|nr:GNAT family N-acetyltransferase [Paenibacillus sp. Marseille-Q4541]